RNIRAGWAKAGLFPFNPDRVLSDTPKPPAELAVPKINEMDSCAQDHVPQTPLTPVSAEAVTSLHNLIKQDAHMLDETSRQGLERHVQKLTNAAQLSFAERALLQEHNQFLFQINNEAKVRRSTKPEILGTARVMSYEDLEKARADRATKEIAKEAKKAARDAKKAAEEAKKVAILEAKKTSAGKKRKSPAEIYAPEPKARLAQMNAIPIAEDETAPTPWMALVAQM
ncbi:hypothetical protein B0T26DRAFT_626908, partial [Lasiosphaeria miniovina]